jgi:hypothetical protein
VFSGGHIRGGETDRSPPPIPADNGPNHTVRAAEERLSRFNIALSNDPSNAPRTDPFAPLFNERHDGDRTPAPLHEAPDEFGVALTIGADMRIRTDEKVLDSQPTDEPAFQKISGTNPRKTPGKVNQEEKIDVVGRQNLHTFP